MDLYDENKNNHPALLKPTNLHQGGRGGGVTGMMAGRKFGVEISLNRREGAQPYPCAINKRSLSQTNGNCDNFNADQVHRPITRKFAAQIANKKNCFNEESKKLKPSSTETFTVWEDCTLTDVVEENQKDQPEPMFLETTESVQDEQMKEVEMEDIFEEPVVDIDECDANNPLAAVEYVDDLYAHYRKMENLSVVSPNYMTQQFDITEKMRAILIDWLIEVHHKFDLQHETIFLTVNLIDRFLAKQGVVRKKLQLVGLVALLLACKYEEVSVPVIEDLIVISDRAYTRKEILEMEKFMLNILEFNMSVPTPYVFMTRFLKAAQSDSKLEQLSFFFIELCLVEYETLKFTPSFLASAAIYTAQCSLYGVKQWSRTCEWHTNYSENQLLECSRMIVGYHEKAATGRLTAVHRKYNTSKHTYAAKCAPARFLLEEEKEETMIIQQ